MPTDIHTMTLDGGIPLFDFINSGYDIEPGVVVERVHSYTDLLILARRVNLFSQVKMNGLLKLAADHPRKAQAVYRQAIRIRTALFNIFSSITKGRSSKIDPSDLEVMKQGMIAANSTLQISREGNTLQLTWENEDDKLEDVLYYFLRSAHDLLTNLDAARIRQCDGCSWFFYDTTKNNKRRWCAMDCCGMKEKGKRYYQKKKRLA